MKKDTQKTVVVFRKFKDRGDILALFPYEKHNDDLCQSYQRIGQHSGADYSHCIAASTPATPKEYHVLKLELESIGYNLTIKQRRQRK